MPTVSFSYTGAPQSFTVPATVTRISADLRGASGGGFQSRIFNGNRGGSAVGVFDVTPGEVLWVYVGGAGGGGVVTSGNVGVPGTRAPGGWNGGGDSGIAPAGASGSTPSEGAGGGATDLRRGGQALSNRILVAGGGGGNGTIGANAGYGGGTVGQTIIYAGENGTWSGYAAGAGGSQTAGGSGAAGAGSGSFGQGGVGATSQTGQKAAGGGGGGWYGGGGGTTADYTQYVYGDSYAGGGGSGYVDPSAVSGTTTSAGGSQGTPGGATSTGHGVATISWDWNPTDFDEVVVVHGSNSTPRGNGNWIRIGPGEWMEYGTASWLQFQGDRLKWNGRYFLAAGASNGMYGWSYDLRRWEVNRMPRMNSRVSFDWAENSIGGSRWAAIGYNSAGTYRRSAISSPDTNGTGGDPNNWWDGPLDEFNQSSTGHESIFAVIAWCGDRFVTAGWGGSIWTSVSGLSWTMVYDRADIPARNFRRPDNTQDTSIQWANGISYMPGKGVVIIGRSPSGNNTGYPYYAFSADMVNWTIDRLKPSNTSNPQFDTSNDLLLYDISNDGDAWIAAGHWTNPNLTFQAANDRPLIYRSTNGTTWDWIDPGENPLWQGQTVVNQVIWTGSVWMLTWTGGTNGWSEMTSPDGINWAVRPAYVAGTSTRLSLFNVAACVVPELPAPEEHEWQLERWAGHPERSRPVDGPQPTGVRFIALVDIDYAAGDIYALDAYTSGYDANTIRHNPFHRFVVLDGKQGTTFANIPYGTAAAGSTNTVGTGSARLDTPHQIKVSPDGRFVFVMNSTGIGQLNRIMRLDRQTGELVVVAGGGGGGTSGLLAGTPNLSQVGRVSANGLIGFNEDDGHLYMVGVWGASNNCVARLEDWDTVSPYFRIVVDGGALGGAGNPSPPTPLSLRYGCFHGNQIWAIDYLRRAVYSIDPPFDGVPVMRGVIPPRDMSSGVGVLNQPGGLLSMGGKLYVLEQRGQVWEWEVVQTGHNANNDNDRMRLIAGMGHNLNGTATAERDRHFVNGEALSMSMATCYSICTDGQSLYVADGSYVNGYPGAGFQNINRLTKGVGIPALRLRQRDDNP